MKQKTECLVEFLDLMHSNEYDFDLEAGHVSDILGLLHKLAPQFHCKIWKLLAVVVKAIDKDVEAEDPHKVKRRAASSRIRMPIGIGRGRA